MQNNLSDFNDLHVKFSIKEVQLQIETAILEAAYPSPEWIETMTMAHAQEKKTTKLSQKTAEKLTQVADSGTAIEPYINGVIPMPMRVNKQGIPILPTEFETAAHLFKYYEGRIVINEGCVFLYENNFWRELDIFMESKMLVQLQVLYNGLAPQTRLQNTYKQFKNILPKPNRNLFDPHLTTTNFLNGTLHIINNEGKWTFTFKKHDKNDFCTNIIPIFYDETRKVKNKAFESMLTRILGDDQEGIDKINAVKQMYAACIMPYFPHLFMVHGPGGTGKSSLIIPCIRLLGQNNWCSVEPQDFEGFNMETMVGKLANIVLDINTQTPIKDHQIKKIEDPVRVRIRRKGRTDALGFLPRVHIFGGNDIPPTYEKGSGAHIRRWTFIRVDKFKAEGNYSKNFANEVFESCPEGVLNFALDGLGELLSANGHYLNPESGKKDLQSWLDENDRIAHFVMEIIKGDTVLEIVKDSKTPKKNVWEHYKTWHRDSFETTANIGKIKFFRFFEQACHQKIESGVFRKITVDGFDFYSGLKEKDGGVENERM